MQFLNKFDNDYVIIYNYTHNIFYNRGDNSIMAVDSNGKFIGTYDEHLEKLLQSHDCLCRRARELVRKLEEAYPEK